MSSRRCIWVITFDSHFCSPFKFVPNDLKKMKSLHGLTRSLIHNMVVGVSEGYTKELEVNGVGYKAAKLVSYTHLDVYKRQPQDSGQVNLILRERGKEAL